MILILKAHCATARRKTIYERREAVFASGIRWRKDLMSERIPLIDPNGKIR